ncbi:MULTISPECIES: cytidine deaminase [Kordiimonas]|uniref:cytidine deaminase n=1 Tax=Kordiimonas TaxID=288021 RepID=UPI001FF61F76|nr:MULTISPECIES: cytidine deaminase [Kordiimonas]MCK0068878.1 cytidine deaminase [Kordiimonas laminariae]UTW58227.1 cytidine deaminase [Kordiimonas sp. SCSIO 12603]
MSDVKADLIEAAVGALQKAYAPYSNHPVGAALLTGDGKIYAGCNVENAAYPLGQCAEATAIGNMVLGGGSNTIKHVVVVGPGVHECTPCGGCRQKIREFAGQTGAPVTICDNRGNILLETHSADLLPHSFGPENIDKVKG